MMKNYLWLVLISQLISADNIGRSRVLTASLIFPTAAAEYFDSLLLNLRSVSRKVAIKFFAFFKSKVMLKQNYNL